MTQDTVVSIPPYKADDQDVVAELRARGCLVPIVADIHFKPDAALEASVGVLVPDASVDAMVIAEILYYVAPVPFSRYGRALRDEVLRTLRPGGRLVLLHPYGPVLHAAYRHHAGFSVASEVVMKTTRSVEMLALTRR